MQKSWIYIDSFFRGESLQRRPPGELKKMVFGVPPEVKKWRIRKKIKNLGVL